MKTPTKPKRGRPPKPRGEVVVTRTLAMRPADWTRLDEIARELGPRGVSRGGAVAELIDRYGARPAS